MFQINSANGCSRVQSSVLPKAAATPVLTRAAVEGLSRYAWAGAFTMYDNAGRGHTSWLNLPIRLLLSHQAGN